MGAARLADGRRLTFSATGPRRGLPILCFHGGIGSPRSHTPRLEQLIRERGIRYVAVNRPGFAGSDPSPGRSVVDFARDVEGLVDAMRWERFSIAGVSAGAPYALACAWALSGRVRSVAVASPLVPRSGPGGSQGPRYALPRVMFAAPGLGPLLADAALRALRLRRATAPRAMLDDYDVCRRPWGFDPAEIRTPVRLCHGRRDLLVPWAHAIALADSVPSCSTHIEARAGHFFFGRHLEEVIRHLVEPAEVTEPPLRLAA
jgi:pimeloyl-ACP methyl ester carboxylesterase